MNKQKPAHLNALIMSYCIVGAFTAISILAPILLGRKKFGQ